MATGNGTAPDLGAAPKLSNQNLEGLDFIETEEDVKAVESAALKIQSTFRGKKIRSKLVVGGDNQASKKTEEPSRTSGSSESSAATSASSSSVSSVKQAGDKNKENQSLSTNKTQPSSADTLELSDRVSSMQVNDNSQGQQASAQSGTASNVNEDDAERAATKIQAGFKGYKTRKELEGKLGSAGGVQQSAPPSS